MERDKDCGKVFWIICCQLEKLSYFCSFKRRYFIIAIHCLPII